jgi:outer membrane scaffolding protein for murein synthesis (MipA/OmpV family)
MKYFLILFLFATHLSTYAQFNHPGEGDFLEIGLVESRSVYGQKVKAPYGVPRFNYRNLTLESTKLDYDLFKTDVLSIGPMINYNFAPYDGSDGSATILNGMKRKGFIDYGVLVEVFVGLGQVFAQYTKGTNDNSGYIAKLAYGTGIPLIPMQGNHMWFNIMLEYTNYSSSLASYMFGVKSSESNSSRPEFTFKNINSFTQIYGLWTPVYGSLWLNFTYRLEKFDKKLLDSPIVSKRYDQSLLAGIMYSFD